jgi:hypothetical protein
MIKGYDFERATFLLVGQLFLFLTISHGIGLVPQLIFSLPVVLLLRPIWKV